MPSPRKIWITFGILFISWLSYAPVILGPLARTNGGGGGGTPTGNSFSVISSNYNDTAVVLPAGSAGDLVIVGVKWESTGTVTTVHGDGETNNYTALTPVTHSNNDLHAGIFYRVVTATGSQSLTTTDSGSVTFKQCAVIRCQATGTISLDTQATGSNTGTAFATGAFTTGTVNGLAIGFYGTYSVATAGTRKIGSNNNTGTINGGAGGSDLWWYINTAQLSSVTANATLSSSHEWAGAAAAFKAL